MRILLIYPDLGVHVTYPIGLGLIIAVLKQRGHEVRVLHLNEDIDCLLSDEQLQSLVDSFRPQLIGFSTTSHQFRYVRSIASLLRDHYDIPTVCGGVHATAASEEVLELGTIDYVCRGEGELAILELIEKIEAGEDCSDIPNIWVKRDGQIIRNPVRPLIMDLDTLPFSDRDCFQYTKILAVKRGWANLMASRGCPFRCTYCVNHFYHKLYRPLHTVESQLRVRSVEHVLAEIEELLTAYPVRTLNFDDDDFALHREWLLAFCEEYGRRFQVPFSCNIRPTTMNEGIARALKAAGCVEVKMGIESGSERVRKQVLKRNMPRETIAQAFQVAEEAGLRAWALNMIGLPTETADEIEQTIELNAAIRPYILRCAIFQPYKGTELYKYCREHNLLDLSKEGIYSTQLEGSVLKLPNLSPARIATYRHLFKWYVDAASNLPCSPLFLELIRLFEAMPENEWNTGRARELCLQIDAGIDALLKSLLLEHYSSRLHIDLRFCKELNFELP